MGSVDSLANKAIFSLLHFWVTMYAFLFIYSRITQYPIEYWFSARIVSLKPLSLAVLFRYGKNMHPL